MTWYQLFNRIGRQPLYKTQHKNVQVKIGEEYKDCKLKFADHGKTFYLEVEEKENDR